jgi:hypothetical protein
VSRARTSSAVVCDSTIWLPCAAAIKRLARLGVTPK